MTIQTELYHTSTARWPKTGQHILGHQGENYIIVYQAYKNSIADYAVKNQQLGGPDFSYNRMSWIKPNFLWMMYRCGWAEKENQERVLAMWLGKVENILREAVLTSFNQQHYNSYDQWKGELNSKNVQLQWDPDHDPFGNKVKRRAIQLGLKGPVLEKFGKEQIKKIKDITPFVKQQKRFVDNKNLDNLLIPVETIFRSTDNKLNERMGIA